MFNWGVKISVVVIYCLLAGYLAVNDLIKGEGNFETDTTCMDIWSVVHFLAGPLFAVALPHWWMCIVVTLWEVLEYNTTGLGDSEIFCNRVVDIIVAIIGWWLVILLFIRHYIPWISSKNAYDDWKKDHSDDANQTEDQSDDDNDDNDEEDNDEEDADEQETDALV